MRYRANTFVLALSIVLAIPAVSALGQIGDGGGRTGGRAAIGGARPGTGGVRRQSSPRSGLGIRSNPIVNPAPSLTPHEVLNPRGSLSSGQVLNPAPSLRRPRSGGVMPAAQQSVAAGGSADRSARPSFGDSTALYFDQLGDQLRQYKNGESWATYLALPKELLSDESTERTSELTSTLLKRFDKLSGDPTFAKVTALPAFGPAHESLKMAVDQTGSLLPPSAATRQQPVAAGGSADRSAPPGLGDSKVLRSTDSAPTRVPVGDRILQSVVALDGQLAKVTRDSGWPKRLSLDELRIAISVTSEQPANDSERKSLEDILGTYQAVAKNNEDAVVNQLPNFKETLAALQEYLKPIDVRRRQDLRLCFDQLGAQLRQYKNGDPWAKYLAPPKALLSDKTTEGTSEPTSKLLKRFDKLSSDLTYLKVTALPAFGPAHESLKLVVDQTDTSPPPSAATQQQPVAPGDQQPVAPRDQQPVASGDQQPVEAEGSAYRSTQPTSGDGTELRLTDPAPKRVAVGNRILQSVVALDRQLAKVAPDSGWPKRLSLDQLLVAIPVISEQPASDSERKSLEDILGTYQAVAKNNEDAVVNKLPEFKETLEALEEYLKPLDARQKD